MPGWEEAKEDFKLRLEGSRDRKTLWSYMKRLRLFEEFWTSEVSPVLPDPSTVTERDMLKFLVWMKRRGYDKNYISRTYGDVVRFLEASRNPNTYYMRLNTPRRVSKVHKYYDDEELHTLLNYFGEDDILSFQNKVYLWILAYTGMRAGEAAHLSWEDINFEEKEITVRHAKMDLQRTVYMPDELADILKRYKEVYDAYMNYRRISGKNTLNTLFFKRKKGDVIEPIDDLSRTIYNRIYMRLRKENPELAKVFNLQKFRTTYIRYWTRARARIEAIARQVGHRNLETTRKYYAEYDLDFVRDEFEKKVKPKMGGQEGSS